MREAATALRYAETTSWMVISRGRAENPSSPLPFSLYALFGISSGERDVRLERVGVSGESRDALFFGRVGYIKMQFSYLAYERL